MQVNVGHVWLGMKPDYHGDLIETYIGILNRVTLHISSISSGLQCSNGSFEDTLLDI